MHSSYPDSANVKVCRFQARAQERWGVHQSCRRALTVLARLPQALGYEAYLSWRFVAGDVSSSVVPPLLFMGAACAAIRAPVGDVVQWLGQELIYFWLFIYTFCLSNQIAGVEEDRINKPHRPLVVGAVSYRGAWVRWFVAMGLFSLAGGQFGVLRWALLWQTVATLHNFGGWSRWWASKNLVMSVGVVAQLTAAWEQVTPLTPAAWRWVALMALIVFPLIALQDLRDLAGDRDVGRWTLPLAFGAARTRLALCVGFCLAPLAIHYELALTAGSAGAAIFCDALLGGGCLAIAWRIARARAPRADHRTYLLFTYWYCMALACAIVLT